MPKLIVVPHLTPHPAAQLIKEYVEDMFPEHLPLMIRPRAEKANYPYYDKLTFSLWSFLNDTPFTRGEKDLDGWNSMAVNELSWTRPSTSTF